MLKFQTLKVWQKAVDLADLLCDVAEKLPAKYQFSFADQLRRAALSIPSNIAEGNGRGTQKDERNFYKISRGSVYESINILVILSKRNLLTLNELQKRTIYELADDVCKMLSGLGWRS